MQKKRLVMSLGMLAFAGAVVVGGTGAFFTDTATSTGNVFTAGDVSLTLGVPTHNWLGAGTVPANFTSLSQSGTGIVFNDLKPGDYGRITNTLTSGSNDSFVCARITGSFANTELAENLRFRTGTGPGGSYADIIDAVPLNTWFSPTAPASALAALPLPGNTINAPIALEYCFGNFITGGPGCTVPNPGAPSWNAMQNQSLGVDVEFYAIQQRNNANFTCASLNPVPAPGV